MIYSGHLFDIIPFNITIYTIVFLILWILKKWKNSFFIFSSIKNELKRKKHIFSRFMFYERLKVLHIIFHMKKNSTVILPQILCWNIKNFQIMISKLCSVTFFACWKAKKKWKICKKKINILVGRVTDWLIISFQLYFVWFCWTTVWLSWIITEMENKIRILKNYFWKFFPSGGLDFYSGHKYNYFLINCWSS